MRNTKFEGPNKSEMRKAVEVLKAGGVIVFPTETSYGIGCDATNAKAVRRVFAIKGRPGGKGTPLIVDSLKMAERLGVFSPMAKKLAKKFWPGPLTIVVPVVGPIHELASAILQNKTVALRVSNHPIARALAKGLGRPLVATSANVSGQPSGYSIRPIRELALRSDMIIDVGSLPRRKPTTLVKVIGDSIEVLRRGRIKL